MWSWGCPIRPMGKDWILAFRSSGCSSKNFRFKSVIVGPGAIAFKWTLYCAHSKARTLVSSLPWSPRKCPSWLQWLDDV